MSTEPREREESTAPEEASGSPGGQTPAGEDPEAGVDVEALKENVVAVLQSVYDPEIPVNIYELGMIYDLDVEPDGSVSVRMTLTSPACPVAGTLPGEVETKVAGVPGVTSSRVELVWDPPWHPGLMSEAARLQTGLF